MPDYWGIFTPEDKVRSAETSLCPPMLTSHGAASQLSKAMMGKKAFVAQMRGEVRKKTEPVKGKVKRARKPKAPADAPAEAGPPQDSAV